MAKTNYTKVEEMLNEGLRKMSVEHLLDMADTATQAKSNATIEKAAKPLSAEQSRLMSVLQHDLSHLHKQGNKPYEKLGIKKKYLKQLIENPQGLTPEEWATVKRLKDQLEEFKKDLAMSLPNSSDEELVEKERKSHKTKRFNINKNWLPLK